MRKRKVSAKTGLHCDLFLPLVPAVSRKANRRDWGDKDFIGSAVQSFVQETLEAEMTEALAAEKGSGGRDVLAIAAVITGGP